MDNSFSNSLQKLFKSSVVSLLEIIWYIFQSLFNIINLFHSHWTTKWLIIGHLSITGKDNFGVKVLLIANMSVLNQSGEEQVECPLCMEPLEVDDLHFYPCTCGYQVRYFLLFLIGLCSCSLCHSSESFAQVTLYSDG